MRGSAPPLAPRAMLRWHVVEPIVRSLAPASTIEIGVGQGAAGARIRALTPGSYQAFEIDAASREVARQRIEPLGGTVHAELLESVDPEPAALVCAFEVLEHISDDEGALRGWSRYIQPGGHLLLSVPADPARFGAMDVRAGHFRRYSREDLERVVRAAGLAPVSAVLYGAPLGYPMEAVRNFLDGRKVRSYAGGAPPPEQLTMESGRTRQFGRRSWAATAVMAATRPFCTLQKVWPGGTGLVLLARKPPPVSDAG